MRRYIRPSSMFQLTVAAVVASTSLLLSAAAATGGSTVLISSSGSINKSAPSIPCPPSGVVTIITSPGTSDPYFGTPSPDTVSAVSTGDGGGPIVVTAQGATLDGSADEGSPSLSTGSGAAAASSVSGSVVLAGVTDGDVEAGLGDTRHGRTLSALFAVRLEQQRRRAAGGGVDDEKSGGGKTLLVVAVQASGDVDVDVASVEQHVTDIFDEAAASVGVAVGREELYDVEAVVVGSEEDASKVMSMATAAASRSPLTKSTDNPNVSYAVTDTYAHITTTGSAYGDPPLITEVLMGCDDAYARHYRSARAKLASWKSRTARGLSAPNFGSAAEALWKRTVELYDRDTMIGAGLASAAPYRLEMRDKLRGRLEGPIRDMFAAQVANLQRSTIRRFESRLLRNYGGGTAETYYADNADALRAATLAFETAMDDLEVPSLSLTKSKAVADMTGKLNSALSGFPDTPAARMKELSKVKAAVSKEKKPMERSVDVGLDVVGMIRPDGFGNFQGFAGYQMGGNQIIVGVHNDADAPEVISQFGGVRPPFIRFQPKLKLDVEL